MWFFETALALLEGEEETEYEMERRVHEKDLLSGAATLSRMAPKPHRLQR